MVTLVELRKIAKEKKIKYYYRKNKETLCNELDIRFEEKGNDGFRRNNAVGVLAVDSESGEERKFQSIYAAAKEFGVNSGIISYRLGKKDGSVTSKGRKFWISRLHESAPPE